MADTDGTALPNGSRVLIVGAARGLGLALVQALASTATVYASCRTATPQLQQAAVSQIIEGIELTDDTFAQKVATALDGVELDYVFVVAGYFTTETFEDLHWDEQRKMMEICAFAPLRLIQCLVLNTRLNRGSKVALITSEGGSIGLRTEKEGGANYGHHMSKCAENMMGRLLAWDLKPRGIPVVMIHPGFLKTDMTRHYSHFYEELGAVAPEEACSPILQVAAALTLETTGRFVAALGSKGLGLGIWAIPDPDSLAPGGDLPW